MKVEQWLTKESQRSFIVKSDLEIQPAIENAEVKTRFKFCLSFWFYIGITALDIYYRTL